MRAMTDLPALGAPTAKLYFKGREIWSDIESEVISLTFTDNLDDEADEIILDLKNDHGRWFDRWFPDLNDELRGQLGYKGGKLLDMGTFFLDEPNAFGDRAGDIFRIRGQSKPVDKALKTPKTREFERKSQRQIAHGVLSEHGLALVGTPPEIAFERVTQRRERDLEFLARLANDYGSFFAVKGKRAIYMDRDELFSRPAVRMLARGERAIISYNLTHKSEGTHSKARVSYFDGNKKKLIDVEAEDRDIQTGDALRIDERVESQGQAKKLAESRLQKANMAAWGATFEIYGDPSCQAGQTVQLSKFGRWDRKYIISSARHRLARGGYTTNMELDDARKAAK
ncbi:phage late control D family protein [Methylocystis sp. S23]